MFKIIWNLSEIELRLFWFASFKPTLFRKGTEIEKNELEMTWLPEESGGRMCVLMYVIVLHILYIFSMYYNTFLNTSFSIGVLMQNFRCQGYYFVLLILFKWITSDTAFGNCKLALMSVYNWSETYPSKNSFNFGNSY